MSLLDLFPELPILLVALAAVLLVRAIRRVLVAVALVAFLLVLGSAVLHWPPPVPAGTPPGVHLTR